MCMFSECVVCVCMCLWYTCLMCVGVCGVCMCGIYICMCGCGVYMCVVWYKGVFGYMVCVWYSMCVCLLLDRRIHLPSMTQNKFCQFHLLANFSTEMYQRFGCL